MLLRVCFDVLIQCDSATSVREFLSQLELPSPTIIGVIGCGCSVATEPVVDMVSVYGVPLVSRALNMCSNFGVGPNSHFTYSADSYIDI